MKKVLSIVLAIAMIATMSVVSFAAAGSASKEAVGAFDAIDVTATYASGEKVPSYLIDLEWENLAFTYTSTNETWDTDEYKWVASVGGSWSAAIEDAVTVTNHSSVGVTAKAAYASAEGYEAAIGTIDTELKTLGIGGAADSSVAYDLSMSGTLPQGTEDAVIGTVTITIADIVDGE